MQFRHLDKAANSDGTDMRCLGFLLMEDAFEDRENV